MDALNAIVVKYLEDSQDQIAGSISFADLDGILSTLLAFNNAPKEILDKKEPAEHADSTATLASVVEEEQRMQQRHDQTKEQQRHDQMQEDQRQDQAEEQQNEEEQEPQDQNYHGQKLPVQMEHVPMPIPQFHGAGKPMFGAFVPDARFPMGIPVPPPAGISFLNPSEVIGISSNAITKVDSIEMHHAPRNPMAEVPPSEQSVEAPSSMIPEPSIEQDWASVEDDVDNEPIEEKRQPEEQKQGNLPKQKPQTEITEQTEQHQKRRNKNYRYNREERANNNDSETRRGGNRGGYRGRGGRGRGQHRGRGRGKREMNAANPTE